MTNNQYTNNQYTNIQYSTTQLLTRPFDDQLEFDENEKITSETKFNINNSTFKIQNSKLIGNPEDKFETVLFLPETEGRKGEGGLRTKGYFKFSYENLMFNDECLILNDKYGNEFKVDNSKLNNLTFNIQHSKLDNSDTNTADFTPHISHLTSNNNTWYITDFYNNPIQPAPPEIQQKINDYFASINSTFKIQHSTLDNPDTYNSTFNIQHSTLDNPDTSNSTFKIQHSTLDKLPLISIITVVFNGEKYLEETIQSVINQTYPNVEYIIIDGGSTDGTLDIIKKYEYAIDYWISEPDKGIYDAMNKGIDVATGDWINFMNTGDSFFDNVVLEKLFVNNDLEKIDVIYGNHQVIYTNRKRIAKAGNIEDIWKGSQFCHQSSFVSSRVHKVNKYNLCNKIGADFELFYVLYKYKKTFKYMDVIVANYSAGGLSDIERIDSIVSWWNVIEKNTKANLYYSWTVLKEILKSWVKKMLVIV